jgi:hypothetical protein
LEVAKWRNKLFRESIADFEVVLEVPSISRSQRTEELFAIVEPMIDHCSLEDVKTALARAFVEGARAKPCPVGKLHFNDRLDVYRTRVCG